VLTRVPVLLVAGLILVSCSTRQLVAPDSEAAAFAYRQRASLLKELTAWDMAGKLSLDDSEDGGSGRLDWQVRDTGSLMHFRAAMGRGAWQLNSGPGYAELLRADGSITRSSSLSDLVEAELGWRIPVDALKWWALGVPAPGSAELLDLDIKGRILAMTQDGWSISFKGYRLFDEVELPGRMDAVHGRYRVKLAVSSWTPKKAALPDD
jgi:outer membrane lipoprotein LolB